MAPTMLDLAEVYAPERMGRPFWFYAPQTYSGGYHRGTDVRKQNAARTASVETDIAAILDGVVVFAAPAPGGALGGTVVIRGRDQHGTVVYESHSHMVPSVKVGDRVRSGQRLGRNATGDDDEKWTGRRVKRLNLPITWGGIHDHTVFSPWSDGAWNTWRKVLDPVPFIKRAIAAQEAEEDPMADLTKTQLEQIAQAAGKGVWDVFSTKTFAGPKPLLSGTKFGRYTLFSAVRYLIRFGRADFEGGQASRGEIAGLTAALRAIAGAKGFDPAAVEKAAREGVKQGLDDFELIVKFDEKS